MPRIRFLLLDRDGTLIKDKHYLGAPEGVEILPGVGEALASLSRKGFRFFMVSNQSGIGRGYFTEEAVLACHGRMAELFAAYGVEFDDMLYCPHAPEAGCSCRKPGTDMWETLRQRHGLASEEGAMVGDKPEDMAFGAAAGLARILVLTGKGEDTARRLGLAAGEGQTACVAEPVSSEHPHMVIEGFAQLERALEACETAREKACGV